MHLSESIGPDSFEGLQNGFQYSSSGRYVYCGCRAEAATVPAGEGDGGGVLAGAVPPPWAPAATGAVASSNNVTEIRAAFGRTVT